MRPNPTVQLEPADLTTSVGDSPLHILVSNLGAPVGDELLKEIAASVTLKTWPEMVPVPVLTANAIDVAGANEDQYAHVYLQSAARLTDRWYALVVDALPAGVDWPTYANVFVDAKGSRMTRFRVGSQPTVASLRSVIKDAGKQVVYVDFSERITGDLSLVTLTSAGTTCSGQNSGAATVQTGNGTSIVMPTKGANDLTVSTVLATCSGPLDLSQRLTLTIQPGLRSTSGPALNADAPRQMSFDSKEWSDWGDGAKIARPLDP